VKPITVNQSRLFDTPVTELLEKYGLTPAIVTEWFHSGYLSYDPVVFDELEEEKEIEFEFVATLFTSGLSHKSVEHLLLNCEKPYRFRILSIYYNLSKKNWEILPTVPEYDIEEEIQNLLDSEEIEILEEIKEKIEEFLDGYEEGE